MKIEYMHFIRSVNPQQFFDEVKETIRTIESKGLVVDPIHVSTCAWIDQDGKGQIFNTTLIIGRERNA
jgi:hypothetical protein